MAKKRSKPSKGAALTAHNPEFGGLTLTLPCGPMSVNLVGSADIGAAEKVLSTASRLFYANGVRAVGIEWIVAESGATKPVTRHRRGVPANRRAARPPK
jgi:hypothetical protein